MRPARNTYPISIFKAIWLLAFLLGTVAQADVGPAMSGITARANDASTVFWSPAGITRIEQPELLMQLPRPSCKGDYEKNRFQLP